jgi:hypothetical protein
MNTVTGDLVADARVIPLPRSAMQPTLSWWSWLSKLVQGHAQGDRSMARMEAHALRDLAHGMRGVDPRFAADLCAAADMHEHRRDR